MTSPPFDEIGVRRAFMDRLDGSRSARRSGASERLLVAFVVAERRLDYHRADREVALWNDHEDFRRTSERLCCGRIGLDVDGFAFGWKRSARVCVRPLEDMLVEINEQDAVFRLAAHGAEAYCVEKSDA